MKNIFLTACAVALLVSCETKKEPKNELEAAEMQSDDLINGGANDAVAFNDGLVAHIDMSEVHLAELYDLDDQDVPAEEIQAAATKIIADLDKRIAGLKTVNPVGKAGDQFLAATINQLKSVSDIVKMYFDHAGDLAIPDDEWTDEMADSWYDEMDMLDLQYEETFDALETAQSLYASYQDMEIVESDVTIEDMYEQSKEN